MGRAILVITVCLAQAGGEVGQENFSGLYLLGRFGDDTACFEHLGLSVTGNHERFGSR
ncbi:unnamed protein product [Gulo gulo]|uniref:MHC class I antigen n=1 Tax=Gulo gulo TaxID=48420 RepID=A0A9X9M336_GULGU|nr:unnamed protein product [Gulo gulo]